MRRVRVRAARTGASQSDVLESALRQGLEVIDGIRSKAKLREEESHQLASELLHEVRGTDKSLRRKEK